MKIKRFLATLLAVVLVSGLAVTGASAASGPYTVAQGDSLWSIAARLLGSGLKWNELYEANKDSIQDPGLIYVGQVLNVPGEEAAPEVSDSMFVWERAPLAFQGSMFDITGGTLSWNPETNVWRAIFPTMYGETVLAGTYAADGTLTLVEDSTGGYGEYDVPPIQAVFAELLAGWESTMLSFKGSMFDITGGTLSWNSGTMEWKASFPTMYGETVLAGTYAADGALTLVEDSTGGYGEYDVPPIQAVFAEVLAGWENAPLSFQGSMFDITGGTLSWNPNTMAWKAVYPTMYGETVLAGTFDRNGTLTLVEDSTGGYGEYDMPSVQAVFTNALAGKHLSNIQSEIDMPPAPEEMPGNAEEYSFTSVVPMENSPLADKNLCVLGSSVVFGSASLEEAVGEYLAARLGCNLTKEAVSGTTLVDEDETSYIQRMLNNLDPNAAFDLFICQLSTNDATQRKELGEISDSKELASFDTSTVTGAMEYIICYAQQTWNCPVVFFTGSNYSSEAYDAMVARLMELQEKWGIGVLDLWTDAEFNNISEEDRELYMSDNIHPTKAGYRDWWGPEMEQQLLDYLAQQ